MSEMSSLSPEIKIQDFTAAETRLRTAIIDIIGMSSLLHREVNTLLKQLDAVNMAAQSIANTEVKNRLLLLSSMRREALVTAMIELTQQVSKMPALQHNVAINLPKRREQNMSIVS